MFPIDVTKRRWLRGSDSVIDVGRYKEVAFVLVAVFVAVFLWDSVLVGLRSQISPHDEALLPQLGYINRLLTGQAVARLQDELKARPGPLGVILGLSTAMVGIDARALTGQTGLRWANLATNGGSFTELQYYSEPLLASDLRPEVVLIGAHEVWLAERGEAALPIPEDNPLLPMRATPLFWAARNSMRLAMDIPIQRARLALLRALGVDMKVLFPGAFYDPFAPRFEYPAAHAPEDWIARLDRLWESQSWFDESAYHANSAEVGRLRSFITELEARGATVVFVILPEPPATRDKLPVRARTLLLDTLDSLQSIIRLDDWDAIADAGLFYDRIHLNHEGRAAYSKRLAAELLPIAMRFGPTQDQP